MRYLDDKRRCPRCGEPLSRQRYLMARDAVQNVMTWWTVAWVVSVALFALILVAQV